VAAIIKRELGVDATLTPGGRGEFTVWLDGKKVLDKDHHGDFPEDDDVLAVLGRP
jgi:predicted Rdx family selenoprotein